MTMDCRLSAVAPEARQTCHILHVVVSSGNQNSEQNSLSANDDAHISLSMRLVDDRAASNNGLSPAQVDQLMADDCGVETHHVLD